MLAAEVVDFTRQDELSAVLKKHNVDTVLSALFLVQPGGWEVERNPLNAAITAGAKIFVPTNFAGPVQECALKSVSLSAD